MANITLYVFASVFEIFLLIFEGKLVDILVNW